MTKKPSPRARKNLDAKELLIAWRIMQESPNYEGRRQFLDWIEGSLKVAGWLRIGDDFYRSADVEKLTKLESPTT